MKLFSHLKLAKLNTEGIAHIIMPAVVVVGVAVVGTYVLVASHADPITPAATSSNSNASSAKLVFASSSPTTAQSLLEVSDGTNAATTLISNNGNSYTNPEWTQNGSSIDYISGDSGLYSVGKSGGTPTLLIKSLGGFTWSQAANKLAFVNNNALITSNADGSDRNSVYTPPAGYDVGSGTWSPDGTKFIVSTYNPKNENQNSVFYTITSSGAVIGRLPGNDCSGFAWAQNSSELVCSGATAIYTVQQGGNDLTIIPGTTTISASDSPRFPTAAPTANRVAYETYNVTTYTCSIFAVNLDGSDKQLLYSSPAEKDCSDLDWSPNGTKIAFVVDDLSNGGSSEGASVYTVGSHGTNLGQVYSSNGNNIDGLNWSIQ